MKKIITMVTLIFMVTILSLGCSNEVRNSQISTEIDGGIYKGIAKGYHDDINVKVEIDNEGVINSIIVGDNTETEGIGTVAIEKIPERIVEAQSLKIDAISGATVTSDAVINATANALESSGVDPVSYGYVIPSEKAAKDIEKQVKNVKMPEKKPITGSVTITDVKGREVTIDTPVSTFGISTMDVIDYIVPLKGEDAFNMLVATGKSGGKHAYDDIYFPMFPNLEGQVGIISEHNAPFDLEMILSKDPDVLIVNSAMQAHKWALEIEPQLKEAGIPLVLIDVPSTVDTSVQETITLLGKIFQEEEKAEEVSAFIDKQFDIVRSKNLLKRTDKPTFYYEKSGYSEVFGSTSSSDSGWGSVIAFAGGENIADSILKESGASKGGRNVIDPEYVLKADPEYIILSGVQSLGLNCDKDITKTAEFDIINRTGWEELSAVQKGNVYEIMHEMSRTVYSFYPTLVFAKMFYPDEFSDVNPDAILDEFFEKYTLIDDDMGVWTLKYK
ncbi:ABC transporter substrate-binding protein [Maledivibacter halophilus]|uniref:Iron complex transport system substrate-binding protein n=1 Tax=Maledivibacter halophilus TaxID=36842 RepID=A0A1T5IJU5_9FIRM|nr:ABC transporter substrate-binding protein [Maledivibacter halophilus]SKC39302.1 iron complex transport system substrate-binding protein [Maledivibacter halophilus]